MPQVISCPKCNTRMQVPDDATGKQVRCPTCQNVFVIGAPTPVPAAVGAGVGSSGSMPRPPASSPPASVPPPSAAPKGAPTKCPACGSELLPGAVACMDCGFLIQSEAAGQAESEAPPLLCPNPACGVANPPGERNCVRCSTPLPTAA